jgi:hypothetical protein
LDRSALAHKDSELARFIKRVRTSPNARFILTTRAYIFAEARQVSEYLADRRLDISKYVLDVGIYTRRIKARIVYNHLLVADTPSSYIAPLIESGDITKIVDHKNYNPRIIEWMTDTARIDDSDAGAYPASFFTRSIIRASCGISPSRPISRKRASTCLSPYFLAPNTGSVSMICGMPIKGCIHVFAPNIAKATGQRISKNLFEYSKETSLRSEARRSASSILH